MDPTLPTATDRTVRDLMDHLAIADPTAAHRMLGHLNGSDHSRFAHRLKRMVDEVIEALAVAVSYTHLTLPTMRLRCSSRWSPYH